MFNPVIVVAIIVQVLVAGVSRIAGAVVGFLITTGILLWGLSVYGEGNQIAFFGIGLSQPVFLIACLVWYALDAREFMAASKQASARAELLKSPLVQDESVTRFYETTLDAWSAGRLSNLGKGFENEGKMQLQDFIKKYAPYEGSALRRLFGEFQPLEGEFLVGVGNLPNVSNAGWFVLTNLRLLQRDGRDDRFKEVVLADVDTYETKGMTSKTIVFKMKSGEEITFDKVKMYPTDKFLSEVISQNAPA